MSRANLRQIEIQRSPSPRLSYRGLYTLAFRSSRRDEGLTILTWIYEWFTEGFDIADSKEVETLFAAIKHQVKKKA